MGTFTKMCIGHNLKVLNLSNLLPKYASYKNPVMVSWGAQHRMTGFPPGLNIFWD